MKVTIEIDIPEIDMMESLQQQLDTLHKQYQATLQLDNVQPSAMLQAFIQEAQEIKTPNVNGRLFIQNLYREAYLQRLNTWLLNRRSVMAGEARALLKALDMQVVSSGIGLQLAQKQVAETFDISLVNRIQTKAQSDAEKLCDELFV